MSVNQIVFLFFREKCLLQNCTIVLYMYNTIVQFSGEYNIYKICVDAGSFDFCWQMGIR